MSRAIFTFSLHHRREFGALCWVDDNLTTAHQLFDMDGEFAPRPSIVEGLELHEPRGRRLPLVLASPHSGSDYPTDFIAASRLDPLALRQSEDSFVDELFSAGPHLGAPLLSARFPRAYLDVNREAYELDPTMFADALPSFVNAVSPRVRIGLGTIARIVANGEEIYAGKLRFADAEGRIERLYHPYHQMLRRLLEETEGIFGGYLLIDCHSMPSSSGCGQGGADIVLGDCYGAACAPRILDAANRFLVGRGFKVAINAPYAGGFTTGFYGRPSAHRHALQVEIDRSLYMDERSYLRKPRFGRLVEDLAELIECLGRMMSACLPKIARTPSFCLIRRSGIHICEGE